MSWTNLNITNWQINHRILLYGILWYCIRVVIHLLLLVYFEMIFQKYNLCFNREKYILSFYHISQIYTHYKWKKIYIYKDVAPLSSISCTCLWSMIILSFRTDFLIILQRCYIFFYQTGFHNTCWWHTCNLCSCFQMQKCKVSPNCLNILAYYQYDTFCGFV